MTIVVLGIDLGKNSCSLVGLDEAGAVVLRRGLRCDAVPGFVEGMPNCIVAMRHVAVRIISDGYSPAAVTRSG